jgi:hypothetical protein
VTSSLLGWLIFGVEAIVAVVGFMSPDVVDLTPRSPAALTAVSSAIAATIAAVVPTIVAVVPTITTIGAATIIAAVAATILTTIAAVAPLRPLTIILVGAIRGSSALVGRVGTSHRVYR